MGRNATINIKNETGYTLSNPLVHCDHGKITCCPTDSIADGEIGSISVSNKSGAKIGPKGWVSYDVGDVSAHCKLTIYWNHPWGPQDSAYSAGLTYSIDQAVSYFIDPPHPTGHNQTLTLEVSFVPLPVAFTCAFTGDSQYNAEDSNSSYPLADATIAKISGELPEGSKGVIVCGDLTQFAAGSEFNQFKNHWYARPEGNSAFPVYEGWGNHDVEHDRDRVLDAICERNPHRQYIQSSAGGHYCWRWGRIYFIMLNLYAGKKDAQGWNALDKIDPHDSIKFLNDTLERIDPSAPVVICQHYGFRFIDPTSNSIDRWWTLSEREAFFRTFAGRRIVAILHGHLHTSYHDLRRLNTCDEPVNVFCCGAARDSGQSFFVLSVDDNEMLTARLFSSVCDAFIYFRSYNAATLRAADNTNQRYQTVPMVEIDITAI
jgi:hypothetical protein